MKNLKKIILICVIFLLISVICVSQNVGINEPNPDNSALLEMTSTERGLLLPRMTTAQRDAIASPAQSLLIFNTDVLCFQTYVGGQWNDFWCDTTSFTCGSTVDDIDGNTYNTVEIGTQCWLKENMRTMTYPGGGAITKGPIVEPDANWGIDNAWYSCPPNATSTAEDCAAAASLGMLYQWSAVMDGSIAGGAQGICPTGWHVPTHDEWTTLERQICNDNGGGSCNTDFPYDIITTGSRGSNGEGSDMADDVADQNWIVNILTADANFGLSGLALGPPGYRATNGNYIGRGSGGNTWSSTESGSGAWLRALTITNTQPTRTGALSKAYGLNVRCLED